jgi:hypothetical protein
MINMAAVLTSIIGLQNLVNLEEFRADYNALQTIDLSNLSELDFVELGNNDILGTKLNSINLTNSPQVGTLSSRNADFSENGLNSIVGFFDLDDLETLDLELCNLAGTIDLTGFWQIINVDLANNGGINDGNITNILITNTQPINTFYAEGCNLTEEAVDNILVALSESATAQNRTGGGVSLQGGNNAPPSATGLSAVGVLQAKSWGVNITE